MDAHGISERLRKAIRLRGWTVREAIRRFDEAKVPGGSKRHVWAILSGSHTPRLQFVDAAAIQLDVSAGWLGFGEGERDRSPEPLDFDPELFGVDSLPPSTREDVVRFAQLMYARADKSNHRVEDVFDNIARLSRGVASIALYPTRLAQFREPRNEIEWLSYVGRILQALRPLLRSGFSLENSDDPFFGPGASEVTQKDW